jgi:transposase
MFRRPTAVFTADAAGAAALTRALDDARDDDEQLQGKQILATCPHLDATASHVAGFADMLTTRTGHHQRLNAWMTAVEGDDLPHLHRFVRGLCTDPTAVINGPTLSHNSGAVEGAVNRIK